jgi:ELWxxDGT repeat protein
MKKTIFIAFFGLFFINIYAQSIDATEIELNYVGDSTPKKITKGTTKVYFAANDGINGEELWVHDLTTNQTHLVKNISSGSDGIDNNSVFMTVGDILYFTPSPSSFGLELWRSDGTESGTYLIKHIGANGGPNSLSSLFYYNGNIFFSAYNSTTGIELWKSDGTTNGTALFKDIYTGVFGSYPDNFFEFNGYMYFTAKDATSGKELWKSDGTVDGTLLFKDIYPGINDAIFGGNIIKLNNHFYFYAYSDSTGYELWKSDGTPNGTQLFMNVLPGTDSSNYNLIGAGTSNYFIFEVISTNGTELWKCDGTVQGTTLLQDIYSGINSGVSDSTQFAVLNNTIFFNATTAINGSELWVTDGSTMGTQLVKDIFPGNTSSSIAKLTAADNYVIFSAKSNLHSYNTPWESDGTTDGTFELKDTSLNYLSNTEMCFTNVNNTVYFPAGDGSYHGIELWTTDGTIANTNLFRDLNHIYAGLADFSDTAYLNNNLIYSGNNGLFAGPTASDGTYYGTNVLNSQTLAISTSVGYRSASYTKAGSNVFFRGSNITNGYEIWKTDGISAANTAMVKDIKTGAGNSIDEEMLFMEFNDIFYFKANDGVSGNELWRSDGTAAGTYLVKDINIGSGSSLSNQSNIRYNSEAPYRNDILYAVLNGYLYFTAYDGTDYSIWKTDGTTNGTTKVITMPQEGTNPSFPHILGSANNKIFFYSYTTLYSSDGTQIGTSNLVTFSNPSYLYGKTAILNNTFYFIASGNSSYELWKTNGSTVGTTLVKNGFLLGGFASLKTCGNNIYFTIGPSSPKQLWRTNGTTIGTIKLGDLSTELTLNYKGCEVCHQNNLVYTKSTNENKIWYVNENSIDDSTYFSVNILNSDNFGTYEGIRYFSSLGNKLLFTGIKSSDGSELFYTDYDFTLSNPEFTQNTSRNSIIVYPNPTTSKVYIKTSENVILQNIQLYDLLGKEVIITKQNNNEIDLSNLVNGIYLIKVSTDKSMYTGKIVLKSNF